MQVIMVVNNPKRWHLDIPNVRVISPSEYITNTEFCKNGEFRVYNLCNAFAYQEMGYYVSLLAHARMHNPQPSIRTIMDFQSSRLIKHISGEIEETANKSLMKCEDKKFELEVFFGKSYEKNYRKLSRELFSLFKSPMFTAYFSKKDDVWTLTNVEPIYSKEILEEHLPFVSEIASDYIVNKSRVYSYRGKSRYSIAILIDKKEALPPSNQKALKKFEQAAEEVGFNCEFITKDDYSRISEFDALFIRTTTNVNDYTYTFARKAQRENIVVIDDPRSIICCANKVFQTEQAHLRKIPMPKTLIVHKGNCKELGTMLGFPLVLKQPDSQFSQGVYKANNQIELDKLLHDLLKTSDLLVAQEFVPTKFDWRIGIFDKKPIFACKYYMAKKHWQIVNKDKKNDFGLVESFEISQVPKKVLNTALKMSNLIGDGLYGVDLKETEDGRVLLIEVNDNPNIDAKIEDKMLGNKLYEIIMQGFMDRVNKEKQLEPLKK